MPNKFGARGIHIAAKEGHVNVIKTLLGKGEQIDAKTSDNKTALHIAVEHGKSAAVEVKHKTDHLLRRDYKTTFQPQILLGNGASCGVAGGGKYWPLNTH